MKLILSSLLILSLISVATAEESGVNCNFQWKTSDQSCTALMPDKASFQKLNPYEQCGTGTKFDIVLEGPVKKQITAGVYMISVLSNYFLLLNECIVT